MSYQIKYTDISKNDIPINENGIDYTTDLTLFGRKRLEYGQDMNANLLHLLENFSCPEDSSNTNWPSVTHASNLSDTNKKLLTTPIIGQLWYNSTRKSLYIYNGTRWIKMSSKGDIAFNWGTLYDGEMIPIPAGEHGYVFSLFECTWIPSITKLMFPVDKIDCSINQFGVLTAKYTVGGVTYSTSADVLVVAIKDNYNRGYSEFPFSMPETITESPEVPLSPESEIPEIPEIPEVPDEPILQSISDYSEMVLDNFPTLTIDDVEFEKNDYINELNPNTIEYIKRNSIFSEEYNKTYNSKYSSIGIYIKKNKDGACDIFSTYNSEKILLCTTNKNFFYVSTDGSDRPNAKPLKDSIFDSWILIDSVDVDFTIEIKSKRSKNSEDYINFVLYASDDPVLDNADKYGQISYRLTKQ